MLWKNGKKKLFKQKGNDKREKNPEASREKKEHGKQKAG